VLLQIRLDYKHDLKRLNEEVKSNLVFFETKIILLDWLLVSLAYMVVLGTKLGKKNRKKGKCQSYSFISPGEISLLLVFANPFDIEDPKFQISEKVRNANYDYFLTVMPRKCNISKLFGV